MQRHGNLLAKQIMHQGLKQSHCQQEDMITYPVTPGRPVISLIHKCSVLCESSANTKFEFIRSGIETTISQNSRRACVHQITRYLVQVKQETDPYAPVQLKNKMNYNDEYKRIVILLIFFFTFEISLISFGLCNYL